MLYRQINNSEQKKSLKGNLNSLYRNSGFLDIFLDLTRKKQPKDEELKEL